MFSLWNLSSKSSSTWLKTNIWKQWSFWQQHCHCGNLQWHNAVTHLGQRGIQRDKKATSTRFLTQKALFDMSCIIVNKTALPGEKSDVQTNAKKQNWKGVSSFASLARKWGRWNVAWLLIWSLLLSTAVGHRFGHCCKPKSPTVRIHNEIFRTIAVTIGCWWWDGRNTNNELRGDCCDGKNQQMENMKVLAWNCFHFRNQPIPLPFNQGRVADWTTRELTHCACLGTVVELGMFFRLGTVLPIWDVLLGTFLNREVLQTSGTCCQGRFQMGTLWCHFESCAEKQHQMGTL